MVRSTSLLRSSTTSQCTFQNRDHQNAGIADNVNRCMVSFIILIGTLRVNLLFVGLFTSLVFLFALIAAADASVPTAATEADLGHILMLLKVAGGFGFVGMCCGW